MPPRRYSRYTYSTAIADADGRLFLTERVPYRYRQLQDTHQHVAGDGDTLFGLAGRHYAGIPRPAGLWWVIADFQPQPIIDPTIPLTPGRVIYIPSLRVVQEEIFNETRNAENYD